MEKLQQLRIQIWYTMYLEIAKKLEGNYTPKAVKDGATLHANNALEAFDARFPQVKSTSELGLLLDTERNPWRPIEELNGDNRNVEFKFSDGSTDLGWESSYGYFTRQNNDHPPISACTWPLSDKTPTHFREITQ